jgi:hypothetical protein
MTERSRSGTPTVLLPRRKGLLLKRRHLKPGKRPFH